MTGKDKKWCSGCKKFHKLRAFDRNAALADGLQTWCREYTKMKRAEYIEANKAKWANDDPYRGTK